MVSGNGDKASNSSTLSRCCCYPDHHRRRRRRRRRWLTILNVKVWTFSVDQQQGLLLLSLFSILIIIITRKCPSTQEKLTILLWHNFATQTTTI